MSNTIIKKTAYQALLFTVLQVIDVNHYLVSYAPRNKLFVFKGEFDVGEVDIAGFKIIFNPNRALEMDEDG